MQILLAKFERMYKSPKSERLDDYCPENLAVLDQFTKNVDLG